ncbi:spermidine synthase [Hymenobacter humi]|uniref:Spermidine synthase n=1 Tax=Hymenobacter humi TaxID=1411620 RepID=A0ABW2U625_9BACT
MNFLQRIVSYVYPLTRKIKSEYNGELELTLTNGRKILDSANANYSYGSLQRILKVALTKIDLVATQNILLLGLGGGSVVATLRNDFQFNGRITAVEIDPAVIRIAKEEFEIIPAENLHIVCADAFKFIKESSEKHDLIIVDLFIDNRVPDQFLSREFWHSIRLKTGPNGYLIFNTIADTTNAGVVKSELSRLGYAVQEYAQVEGTNTIFIGHCR